MGIFGKRKAEIKKLNEKIWKLVEINNNRDIDDSHLREHFLKLEGEIATLKTFKIETENNIRLKEFKKLIGKVVSTRERSPVFFNHPDGSFVRRNIETRENKGKLLSVKIINHKFEIIIENNLGVNVYTYKPEDLIYIKKYVL